MAQAPPKRGLGRGLESLISSAKRDDNAPYFVCPVDRIDAMKDQPRSRFDQDRLDELAASIRESGVIQPLIVRAAAGGRYALIAGERRLRAAKLAGLREVPVVVREATDDAVFALALIENIQRQDLNPIEEGLAFKRLIDAHGHTQEELAKKLGKSRSAIANTIRLLKLPPIVRGYVADGTLSAGHARAVLSVDEDLQPILAERVTSDGLNVRQAEDLARTFRHDPAADPGSEVAPSGASDIAPSGASEVAPSGAGTDTPPSANDGASDGAAQRNLASAPDTAATPEPSTAMKAVQRQLMEHFGTRVTVQKRAHGGGVVEIHFADDRALQGILDAVLGR